MSARAESISAGEAGGGIAPWFVQCDFCERVRNRPVSSVWKVNAKGHVSCGTRCRRSATSLAAPWHTIENPPYGGVTGGSE